MSPSGLLAESEKDDLIKDTHDYLIPLLCDMNFLACLNVSKNLCEETVKASAANCISDSYVKTMMANSDFEDMKEVIKHESRKYSECISLDYEKKLLIPIEQMRKCDPILSNILRERRNAIKSNSPDWPIW